MSSNLNPYSQFHQSQAGFGSGANAVAPVGGRPNYKRYDQWGHMTPNFEYSEGIRPAGEFQVAPYLPEVRYNIRLLYPVVLSGGKVVSMDSNGYIVPAGLQKQLAALIAKGAVAKTTTRAGGTNEVVGLTRYTVKDVEGGVRNAAGAYVVDGEAVVESFVAGANCDGAVLVSVSKPVGISSYNYWRHAGGNGENPALFNQLNFSLQNKVAFVCDYQLELPIVTDRATYAAAPFAGMGAMIATSTSAQGQATGFASGKVFKVSEIVKVIDATPATASVRFYKVLEAYTAAGALPSPAEKAKMREISEQDAKDALNLSTTAVKPGMFVTYDMDSNFVLTADEAGYGYGATTKSDEVIGQVLSLDMRLVRDYLDKVRSPGVEYGGLEAMPGTATGGKSDTLTYSGGVGLVRINLQNR